MKKFLAKYVSFLLGLTALAVLTSTGSVKAQTTSTTTPMYTTYTDSSKSVVGTKLSDSAVGPSSTINPTADNRETQGQQVIDRLGDSSETPSPEATAQISRIQQGQPKGAGAIPVLNPVESRDAYQQVSSSMPKASTPVRAGDDVATQPAPETTSRMPKESATAQSVAGASVRMPKAQTQVSAGDESATAQLALGKTITMPKGQTPVPATEQSATKQPFPGTTVTSAADLTQKASASPIPQSQPQNQDSKIAQVDITPGRPTRAGYSYFGIGGNIGVTGIGTSLSSSNFAILSKIGLTDVFSVRPAVVFGGDTTFLLPITYDFALGNTDPFQVLRFAPYLGAGPGYSTNGKFGFVLTGGLDIPLTREFTATIGLNAFLQKYSDLGLLLGVGYNFIGF